MDPSSEMNDSFTTAMDEPNDLTGVEFGEYDVEDFQPEYYDSMQKEGEEDVDVRMGFGVVHSNNGNVDVNEGDVMVGEDTLSDIVSEQDMTPMDNNVDSELVIGEVETSSNLDSTAPPDHGSYLSKEVAALLESSIGKQEEGAFESENGNIASSSQGLSTEYGNLKNPHDDISMPTEDPLTNTPPPKAAALIENKTSVDKANSGMADDNGNAQATTMSSHEWAESFRAKVGGGYTSTFKRMETIMSSALEGMMGYLDQMEQVRTTWETIQRNEREEAAMLQQTEDDVNHHVRYYHPTAPAAKPKEGHAPPGNN